jgi:hypothetical protein
MMINEDAERHVGSAHPRFGRSLAAKFSDSPRRIRDVHPERISETLITSQTGTCGSACEELIAV